MTALPPDDDVEDRFDGARRVHGALRWIVYMVVLVCAVDCAMFLLQLLRELWRSS